MTDAEIVELLGGGKAGAERHRRLQRLAKHRPIFDRCMRCSRVFVSMYHFWLARGDLCPAGCNRLEGRWEGGKPICLECVPLVRDPAPTTPRPRPVD
jgi:hypothetical protein